MTLHRGRIPANIEILGIRPLTRDDLDCIREKRNVPVVQRFRDPHHRLARLLASGLRPAEAASQVGYSLARIYILNADPSFQDLVAAYRRDVHEAYISAEEERHKTATEVNLKALRHINERFDKADEEGELVPIKDALAVFADTSDRVGLSKKSLNVNINVDFAAKLEAARQRSLNARVPRLIEGRSAAPPAPQFVNPSRSYIEGTLVRKV